MAKTTWVLDPTHSEIQFKVKHLMISTVTGQFKQFTGSIETNGEDFTTAKVNFTADISSISTNNDQRDVHLNQGDFFDAANHPQLIFTGDKLEKADGDDYKLYGSFTIKGITKKVVLDAEFGGQTQDPWGNTRVGFSVTGKINRVDFGISFSMVSETGGILLGEDIKINANVQFVNQAVLQPA